jgi:hypothetical protein
MNYYILRTTLILSFQLDKAEKKRNNHLIFFERKPHKSSLWRRAFPSLETVRENRKYFQNGCPCGDFLEFLSMKSKVIIKSS